MLSSKPCTTYVSDFQLVLGALRSNRSILSHAEYYPEKFSNDWFLQQILKFAQEWDKLFQQSLSQAKEGSHE